MSANLTMTREIECPTVQEREEAVARPATGDRITRWSLITAQILVLLAYAMGMAFLVRTTAGTLVLFSLIAPVLVGIALLTLLGIVIYEFRRRHALDVFEVYDSGQIIIRQGEPGDCAYFIQSGEVEMVRHENGADRVIARLSEGDCFGEKALISSAPRLATIRALTQTRVGIIRKRSFLAMVIVLPTGLDRYVRRERSTRKGRRFDS
ncbi:MAG TPA: cyclic nucleotide-binding domain-containing protein [Terriglobales bacterium]|nr:cyclic nucleotide-binding domain-containing protein [Terriglobales bacterium]